MSVTCPAINDEVSQMERDDIKRVRDLIPDVGPWRLAKALKDGKVERLNVRVSTDEYLTLLRRFRHVPFYTTYSRIRRYDAGLAGKTYGRGESEDSGGE